jgi:hypothetical protein
MPTDLSDAETGGIDLYFADDLEGMSFYLRDPSIYDAEEVRDEIDSDIPKFGRWIPVHTCDGNGKTTGTGWIVAVGELIEELQRYDDPVEDPVSVTRCEKSGTEQTDPYEVNTEKLDTSSQAGLPS